MRPPAVLFGVAIDDLTMDEAIDLIEELARDGRAHGRTHQIATVNVDFLVNAIRDDQVRRLLQQAEVCIADGMPVVWGARLAGMPIKERVAGADLVPELVARSVANGLRIHCFGSSPDVAERARTLFQTRYPGAAVTTDSGPVMKDVTAVDDAVLGGIVAIDPDVLCVALGNPKQERFIAAHRARLASPVLIGVGGSLDLLVGDKKRAPRWVQRSGLEWVVRALQEPRRLGKRYAVDAFVFGPRLLRYLLLVRRYRKGTTLCIDVSEDEVVVTGRGPAGGPVDDPRKEWSRAAEAIRAGSDLRVDLSDVTSLDARSVAALVGLNRVATRCGRSRHLSALSPRLLDELARLDIGL